MNNQEYQHKIPPVTRALLLITIAVFLLQLVSRSFLPFDITALFALSRDTILQWQLWCGVTYIFLHGGFLHIFLNMLFLFMFGREMEEVLGSKRFLSLYIGSGILAGVGWIVISGSSAGYCLGASGAAFGIMGAFAAIFPARKITLLLFFVLPITMTARTMIIGMAVVSLYAVMGSDGNIAHAAHLAGGLAGYLYGLNIRKSTGNRMRTKGRRVDTRYRRKNIRIIPQDSYGTSPLEDR